MEVEEEKRERGGEGEGGRGGGGGGSRLPVVWVVAVVDPAAGCSCVAPTAAGGTKRAYGMGGTPGWLQAVKSVPAWAGGKGGHAADTSPPSCRTRGKEG